MVSVNSEAIREKLDQNIRVRMCASWKNLPGYYLKNQAGSTVKFDGTKEEADSPSVQWRLVENSNGTYSLESKQDRTRISISASSGLAHLAPGDEQSRAQQFLIECAWSYTTQQWGFYLTNVETGKVLASTQDWNAQCLTQNKDNWEFNEFELVVKSPANSPGKQKND